MNGALGSPSHFNKNMDYNYSHSDPWLQTLSIVPLHYTTTDNINNILRSGSVQGLFGIATKFNRAAIAESYSCNSCQVQQSSYYWNYSCTTNWYDFYRATLYANLSIQIQTHHYHNPTDHNMIGKMGNFGLLSIEGFRVIDYSSYIVKWKLNSFQQFLWIVVSTCLISFNDWIYM